MMKNQRYNLSNQIVGPDLEEEKYQNQEADPDKLNKPKKNQHQEKEK